MFRVTHLPSSIRPSTCFLSLINSRLMSVVSSSFVKTFGYLIVNLGFSSKVSKYTTHELSMKKALSSDAVIPSEEFFNQVGIQYEEAFGHNAGLQRIVQHFLKLLPGDAQVLDCGCGTGKPVAEMIAQSGRVVNDIDLSQTMVELSSKQVPTGSFTRANMLHYTPADHPTGVIAMLSLFALTRQEISLMAHKWFQWLQPNGYLLIGVIGAEDCETAPEMYDSDGQCATGVPFTFMNHKVSVTLFTKAGWNALLKQAGFEIIHTETDIYTPPPATVCDDEPHYFVIARKSSSI